MDKNGHSQTANWAAWHSRECEVAQDVRRGKESSRAAAAGKERAKQPGSHH